MSSHLAIRALGVLLACHCVPGLLVADQKDSAPSTFPRVQQRGLFIHDPSTIAECNKRFWVFSTGPGISSWHSADLTHWTPGPRVFTNAPSWTTNIVPDFRGYFWAPDVIRRNHQYFLYYSVSSWGKNISAIGVATNATLDPGDASFHWGDAGLVLRSRSEDSYNAIDPSVFSAADGTMWLAFGSFWSGIKLAQLEPLTGRQDPDLPLSSLAWNPSIEAPCLCQHGPYFYLFVNWGLCCRGTNSTYNIRVGRSNSVTGPYLDRDGKDLLRGGGTLFLDSKGKFIGPGHAGVYSNGPTNWLTFHYYDGTRHGAATLALRSLNWTSDGWPQLGEFRSGQ